MFGETDPIKIIKQINHELSLGIFTISSMEIGQT